MRTTGFDGRCRVLPDRPLTDHRILAKRIMAFERGGRRATHVHLTPRDVRQVRAWPGFANGNLRGTPRGHAATKIFGLTLVFDAPQFVLEARP